MKSAFKDILVTGAADFMAPYLYDALRKAMPDDVDIWMLGTGDRAGIGVDLTAGSVTLPAVMSAVIHCDASDSSVADYDPAGALQAVRDLTEALTVAPPSCMVYLSSVDVYGVFRGEGIDETADCDPTTSFGRAKRDVEEYLAEWCDSHGVKLAVLRPAMIVGTGMGGALRRLVNRIYRATYRHVAGNEARVSVVHATSVADAVVSALGLHGVWNVTDGVDPTRHDLAEALAWRLDNKRIYTVSASKARLMARIGDYIPVTGFTSRSLDTELSTLTFDGGKLVAETGFEPVSVTHYLRNHRYDESSL